MSWAKAALVFLALAMADIAYAQEQPPLFRDPNYITDKPDLSGLRRLRFLTTLDYPPFNFADANKRPTGFNVDLARALCEILAITAKCEVQALPWNELADALDAGRGEAIIAGTAVSAAARARFALTDPYFRLPARFATRKDGEIAATDGAFYEGQSIAVIVNTAHEAMLRDVFAVAEPIIVDDQQALYDALMSGTADMIFGDGITLSFWLVSQAARDCCALVGGPYLSPDYLGRGMVIAVRPDDQSLRRALDHALSIAQSRGDFAEIYARYFPLDPFALP